MANNIEKRLQVLESKVAELTQKLNIVSKKEMVELSTLNLGDVFSVNGREYIVLKQLDGITKIITKDCIGERVVFDDKSTDYSNSKLSDYIEGEIQPMIESDFGADNLVYNNADLTTVDMQKDYGSISRKVRPLTFDEAREFNNLLVNENIDGWYWTCTPWSTEERGWKYSMAVVSPSGNVRNGDYFNLLGVRPLCILESSIFVSKVGE